MIRFKSVALRLLAALAILMGGAGCGLVGRSVGVVGALVPVALSAVPTKLLFSCIPEGTPIDTPTGPRAIESIRPGDAVIGFDGAPIRVLQVHGYVEDPSAVRFYRVRFEGGAEVQLCDMHRVGGIRARNLRPGDRAAGQIVESVEVFGGVVRSYDLLTGDPGYRVSGLPVNSMIEEMAEAARDGTDATRD